MSAFNSSPWFVAHEQYNFGKKVLNYLMDFQQRKSHTSLGKIYFWTATIHKWLPLLQDDSSKSLIIGYLKKLSDEKLITVYAFVLMPNHIH